MGSFREPSGIGKCACVSRMTMQFLQQLGLFSAKLKMLTRLLRTESRCFFPSLVIAVASRHRHVFPQGKGQAGSGTHALCAVTRPAESSLHPAKPWEERATQKPGHAEPCGPLAVPSASARAEQAEQWFWRCCYVSLCLWCYLHVSSLWQFV